MTEHVIDVVPGLVRKHKADGRSVYDKAAKTELVRRCRADGVSVAKMALVPVRTGNADLPPVPDAGYLELGVPGGTIRVH
jgi:hypothetical protein